MNINISKYKKAMNHIKKALDFMEKAFTTAPTKKIKKAKKGRMKKDK